MSKALKFFKTWMLPIGMTTGALMYLVYHWAGFLHPAGGVLLNIVKFVQPVFLFTMLFLTFCRIEPHEMKPHRWHFRLLAIQAGTFTAMALALAFLPEFDGKVIVESAMICMICPTATAAAVVTDKLGGDIPGIVTYTVLINLVTALIVPLLVPLVHPVEGVTFIVAFSMIMAKVFPLLICPCILAWIVRYMFPHIHAKIVGHKNLAFYIWAVSLTLAILMTTRAIFHSGTSLGILLGIGGAALATCALQFFAGKRIGERSGEKVTAGQSLGQKNTVFAIWMGYTFMDSVTSVAGGFYSIWHNCYNSWQLYRAQKK